MKGRINHLKKKKTKMGQRVKNKNLHIKTKILKF